uniref:Large ribosomal subunit protein uL23m n=1 Tax=Chromera velia CCMP2878 TaxID=1169474 RepID=A0A0G4GQN0_9ALVE|mmetsp:Transcript_55431/g.108512  ORF Transcript_55431/g.108512 Transcript_55431/m.108512 type:complete len:276 (+) Transcript_55431:261-1088(+)|eukprot:Cvel_5053.t1-p1 / transcript=Cvel_5053.t1 / gene=Cvel_5053 / organism=Chromera_velia_CCMP2878 / gene_product=hypothetical protein / transcript_product=hypothetical protein / location=Cvel_scaffold230:54198-57471(-) / protein_length=275 / sequence_SO=supercontig / SO=protein_coding / is_pseudo=false
MLFLSLPRRAPPKTPRNVFFPWQNFVLHRSGAWLEKNRVAFKVPVNFTKPEIREYLRRIYGLKILKVNTMIKQFPARRNYRHHLMNYYKKGPVTKKAVVTLEDAVPDEVKMMGGQFGGSRRPGVNPAITKNNTTYGTKPLQGRMATKRPGDRERGSAWTEEIPSLLAGNSFELDPKAKLQNFADRLQRLPDPSEPFIQCGVKLSPYLPNWMKESQEVQRVDLTPWRRLMERQRLMRMGREGAVDSAEKMEKYSDDQYRKTQPKLPPTTGPWRPPN